MRDSNDDAHPMALVFESPEPAEEHSAPRRAEADYLRLAQEVAGLGVYFRNFKTGEAY